MEVAKLACLIEELIEQDGLSYSDIGRIVNQIVKDEGLSK